MQTKPAKQGFATTEIRIFTKAICTRLIELNMPRAKVRDAAYALDPTLVDDPTYGRDLKSGPETLSKRFDRWRYPDSRTEIYHYLPGAAPAYVYRLAEDVAQALGTATEGLPGPAPAPLTAEGCKALWDACGRAPEKYPAHPKVFPDKSRPAEAA